MLSKNNYHEKLRKMEPRKERFSIRKFSIGAASVLIGFSFMSMAGNQKVQAATEENPVVVNNAKNNEHQSNGIQQNVKIDEANKATDAEKVNPTTTSSQNSTDSKLTQSPAQDSSNGNATSDSKNALKDATSEVKQDNKATQPETSTASKEVNNESSNNTLSVPKTNTLNINKVSEAESPVKESKVTTRAANLTNVAANTQATQTKTLRGTQAQDVSDWQGFVNAMNDASVGTINLTRWYN